MAAATLTRDRPRGHLRAVQLAGAASLLVGIPTSWAQEPYAATTLPFCDVYPPGVAPAIGPSNCTPVPAGLWGPTTAARDLITAGDLQGAAGPTRAPVVDPLAAGPSKSRGAITGSAPAPVVAQASRPDSPPGPAPAPKPPAPRDVLALKTPGAITLDQIAAMLGPASKRTITFALSPPDAYKTSDLTHRVRLSWTGPLQALVDQLGAIYGLDVAIDDAAIRFSSRQAERPSAASTTRTP